MTRNLADNRPVKGAKKWSRDQSGHVTTTKIENLHVGTCRKIH